MTTSPSDTHRDDDGAIKRVGEAMEANPLAVLVGGAAIGMIAGAMLPRTEREAELFGPIGKRMTAAAVAAAKAARETGLEELQTRGISGKAARAQIGQLIDGVAQAASSAGEAAASAAAAKAKPPAAKKSAE